MSNTTLIRVLGLVGIVCIAAVTAVLIMYPGTAGEKVVAAAVVGGLITVIGGQLLNLKQSGDNAVAIAKTVEKVADNTALTIETQQTSKETHQAVNHRMDDLIAQVQAQGRTLAELAGMRGREAGIKEGLQQAADATQPATPAIISVTDPDKTIEMTAPATIEVKVPDV